MWSNLTNANSLKQDVANKWEGLTCTKKSPSTQKGTMFSESFLWALKNKKGFRNYFVLRKATIRQEWKGCGRFSRQLRPGVFSRGKSNSLAVIKAETETGKRFDTQDDKRGSPIRVVPVGETS